MKKLAPTILSLVILLCFNEKSYSQESLYKRLGGYDVISAVTDDFITRLATNKDISRFFVGLSDDSKTKVRQHIVDFLCAKSGGPCAYTGRTMKDAHKGLKITENDWNISAGLLGETLKKFNVPKKETDEVFAFVTTLKNDIVEVK
ncbi:MAG TPA: group 1 truncated hemoglobin [Chitinophagaceae bacterium]|jgi:hemoglobin|nr:group 1 truncated hemoglobin [Chitinophagaceae bacterium]